MRNKMNILAVLMILILVVCLAYYLIIAVVIKPHKIDIRPIKENFSQRDIINISPEEQVGIPDVDSGSSSTKSGSVSPSEINLLKNDVPTAKICPASLEVNYLIDYAGTQNIFSDDTVYLGIRNNNQLPESINIQLDNSNEGDLHIKGLGLSIMKSEALTNWWKGLFAPTQRTVSLILTLEECQPISSSLTITFPPDEGDYLD